MARRGEPALFDAGLQLERTHLAWSRTALAIAVNAILVGRLSRHVHPHGVGLAVALALAVLAAATWWHGRSAYAPRSAALHAGVPALQPRVHLVLARATTILLFAVTALALSALVAR
ncbi:DUF202 domain-containing protein [Capillimicrobium parvum]|uniref:DUF202 domain-containing protein n=1 Tax=Capillimicrobium parvum TaxID=2884022 RepID=A0A9E6Y306_9ACTN|nr:DUF202 domain-containing protein [Capillimicrobium parvum]UGS38556.1 hypothetical protein DSM104329_04986 [Capillimicrobium parvum]